jgi:hypothetical protein
MKKSIDEKCLFSKTDAVSCIILTVIATCFFYYVNSAVKPINEWETLKYATPDSKTYLDVGKWLFNEADFDDVKNSVAIRPFFYPLIVAILESIHPLAIWIFQFILWQLQIFIIYISCVKTSNSKSLAFIVALASISIVSPIGMTLHALTETLASFFITFSVFVLTLNLFKRSFFLFFIHLLSLSFCSVTRPSFLYVYIFSTMAFILNKKNVNFLYIFILFITAVPISVQSYIMKKHFGIYQLSFIDALAINDYFLPRLELYKKNIEKDIYNYQYIRALRDQRRSYMAEMVEKAGYETASKNIKKELFNNLKSYPVESFRQFKDLIVENSMQSSSFFTIKMFNIMSLSQSKLLLTINIISILFFLAIIILTKFVKEKNIPNDYILYIISIFFTIFFTYFSTGITFWQGDRLLVPIYYASIVLFTCQVKILFEVIDNINQKNKIENERAIS